jgi:hypothetical protein
VSRTRTAVKYTIATSVSILYVGAIYQAMTQESLPVKPRRVAIVASSLAVLTWIAAIA